jgi:excisionase family DNA binding protein
MTDKIFITTTEAAARLGVTVRRVQAMINDGVLPAQKSGRDWLIQEHDLGAVQLITRKVGRPGKQARKVAEAGCLVCIYVPKDMKEWLDEQPDIDVYLAGLIRGDMSR